MAFSRLPAEEAATFIPKLLPGIAGRPAPQRNTILHMVLPVSDEDIYINVYHLCRLLTDRY